MFLRQNLKKNNPDILSLDLNKLSERPLKEIPAADQNQAEEATRNPVAIVESPAIQRDVVEIAAQLTAEQALYMAEMQRSMKEQIDELQQPVAVEEETTSRLQEPTRKAKEEVVRGIERAPSEAQEMLHVERRDYQPEIIEERHIIEKSSAGENYNDPKEPIKFEAIPSDTSQVPNPTDMLPATAEISGVLDEETPLAVIQPKAQAAPQVPEDVGQEQPNLDMSFDFQELELSSDEVEPYYTDDRPLEFIYEEEPLVAEEALSHSVDLAEAGVLPQHEAIFDDEVMDTFEQLIELAYAELAETPKSGIEQHAELIDDQVVFMNPETPDSIEPNAFEEFVIAQSMPEASPDLDTIIASANKQTLEETLVQLSFYLMETSQDSENPDIEEILKDLAELLPRSDIDNTVEEEKVTITPELTQKLLTLLSTVGYDNPQEVLLALIKQHDFEFLFQAIRYLSQLCNDDSRQELLHKQATVAVPNSDEPLTARLGRAILSLITRLGVTEVATSD